MLFLWHIWLFMTDHGYGAVIEFIVDLGDHVVSHVIALVVIKAGAAHVTYKVVKHVRARKANKSA